MDKVFLVRITLIRRTWAVVSVEVLWQSRMVALFEAVSGNRICGDDTEILAFQAAGAVGWVQLDAMHDQWTMDVWATPLCVCLETIRRAGYEVKTACPAFRELWGHALVRLYRDPRLTIEALMM